MEEPVEAAVPTVEQQPAASAEMSSSSSGPTPPPPPASVTATAAAAADTQPASSAESLPPERIGRGLLFALPVVPVGVFLWVLIWQWGFMSAIVMFAVSAGAAFLYRKGSGGRIGYPGLWVIVGLTVVTLVLSFLGGIAADVAEYMGLSMANALGSSDFWTVYFDNLFANPKMWDSYTKDILFAVLFAGLGTLGTFRRVLAQARAAH
ncbi:hypothetical protein [Microbacterium candidum]|uniref:Uncharacterized protein n=1 Tax=Microbacterium candidum TaxID=3041922 RepID=A0ABT7MZX6_9MICO|nr:hypothetical protein [Microbacterium sp. ASV49]MDL9980007.1 hypothetical protein [Microbacterium sp. ASV49]